MLHLWKGFDMKSTIFALLTGASALALLTGGALAQGVVNPPFVPNDVYTVGGNAPKGADLTNINVPGAGILAPNMTGVVEDMTGTPILASQPGVLNTNGTPVSTTYGAEATATSYVAPAVDPGNVGGGYAAGSYVINASGQLVTPAQEAACTPATCTFVAPSATDPLKSFQWVPATYSNDPGYAASSAVASGLTSANSTGTYTAGDVALTSTGAIATSGAQCTATAKCTFAAANANDPALASPTNYTAKVVTTQPQGQGYGKVSTNQGSHTSTTSVAGGAVYANDTGQTAAIGAGGVTIASKTGKTGTVTADGAQWTSSQGSVTISADPYVSVSTPQAGATLGANGNAAGVTAGNANGYVSMGVNGSSIGFVAVNTVTGASTSVTPDGVNTSGSVTVGSGSHKTVVSNGNITTTGTVTASSVVASTGFFDTLSTTGYSDVGATLRADDAAIKMLNNKADAAYSKATTAQNSAAIVAAFPPLQFANNDMFAVGIGGADAGGTGAWAASAAMKFTPRFTVGISGGQANSTGVVAIHGSYSFGAGAFLK